MDQIQGQLDPEVAGELIVTLNRKVTNLRRENAELRVWLNYVLHSRIVPTRDEAI